MSRGRYFAGLARLFGVDVDLFADDGVLVVPAADRSGQRRVTLHRVDRHAVLWIDPHLENELSEWRGQSTTPTFEEFRDWAFVAGATLLGHGLEHLLPEAHRRASRAPELTVIDGGSPTGIELVQTLLDECSADDLDEAEFEIEALDPFLVGRVESNRLVALAGGRTEPARPGCMDIGVLVHPDHRQVGHGRGVVTAVADELIAAGHLPLYRCASSNVGSRQLCRSVGFELALELEAFEWPAVPPSSEAVTTNAILEP